MVHKLFGEQYNFYTPPNLGVMYTKVPQDILDIIKSGVDAGSISNRDELAGNLSEEYLFPRSGAVEEYIADMFGVYYKRYYDVGVPNINIKGMWINKQKKHEFNPLHRHYGIAGFVIWVQIPYSLQEELSQSHTKGTNKNCASMFEFAYNKITGELSSMPIPIDKQFEGTLMIFPAALNHQVYPFYTSDDYRISVAGNIELV